MGSEEGLWTENWHTGEKWKKKKKKVNEASKPENVTRQRNGEGKEMGRHDTFEAILLPWYYY